MKLSSRNPRCRGALRRSHTFFGAMVNRALHYLLVIFLLSSSTLAAALAAPAAQGETPADRAAALLAQLTPEEKVGQLFIVAFKGTDAGEDSQIHDLIVNHFIGGVVLQAANDNFTPPEQTIPKTYELTSQIQNNAWTASQQTGLHPELGENWKPAYIPQFIAVSQEGNGYPYDQILNGMTPLANEMALGATWNPDLARSTGSILGKELSALGFNMVFGPALDVLEPVHPEGTSDLGTRTFGGDPSWVSRFGSAYTEGIHQGSAGRVAVIAKHFPGHGGSDRLPEEEVATIRKSLDQLVNFDLVPFYAVTGEAASPGATADGLLASHVRYLVFQGNIRPTTRPVSLDPQAFGQLMSLTQLSDWQKNGGVMVSDDLGGQAIRRFYQLTNQKFDPRRVALNAFIAGNDLLYFADFSSVDEADSYTAAIRTLDFMAQKYREDSAFSQRVDKSVLRILTLKYRLYGNFELDQVIPPQDELASIGGSGQVTFEVAQQGATLISPSLTELVDAIPDPPNLFDRIVFITDTRNARQCSTCEIQTQMEPRALEDVVLRRFGPQAGGLVAANNLASYSLAELKQLLDAGEGDTQIEKDLNRANWIVFSLLPPTDSNPSFSILSRFLNERPDLFQQKRLVVFSFAAPYYLDATNISKLTAYYSMYSKQPQFVDIASYLLFRELEPAGDPPVSVPSVGYNLNESLFPDPAQSIPLEWDIPEPVDSPTTTTPAPSPTPNFQVGAVIPVRTGVVLDHNGHPVPDGTPVEFILTMGGELRQVESTRNGIARTTFLVTNSGTLEIRAESEPAKQSTILKADVHALTGEVIMPTPTVETTPTQTPTLAPTSEPTPTAAPLPVTAAEPPARPKLGDWIMALLVTSVIALSVYRLSALLGQIRWGIRGGFLALIGGLLAYSYLALQMPGSQEVLNGSIARGVFLTTLLGSGLGLFISWVWRNLQLNSGISK